MDNEKAKAKRKYEMDTQSRLIEAGHVRTCTNCEFWNQDSETCGYEDCNMRPPATVIVLGCINWRDCIPF